MIRFLLFLLLFQFSTNSELSNQLGKFPVLLEHFQEHKSLNKEVSLTDYLAMHYWGNDLNDDDDERDNALPFKSLDAKPAHCLYVQQIRQIGMRIATYTFSTSYPIYTDQDFNDPLVIGLFKPPCA